MFSQVKGQLEARLDPGAGAGDDVDKWIWMLLPSGPEDGDRGVRPSSASPVHLSLSRKIYQVF